MTDISTRVAALLPGGDVAAKRARLSTLRGLASRQHRQGPARDLDAAVRRYVAGDDDVDIMAAAHALTNAVAEEAAQRELFFVVDGQDHELRGQAEDIQERHTYAAVAYLGEQLKQVVRDVGKLDLVLGDVTTPTDAIRRGLAHQWGDLDNLLTRYNEIREQQSRIYRAIAGVDAAEAQAVMLRFGLLADSLTATPEIRTERIHNAQVSPDQYPEDAAWVTWLRSAPPALVDSLDPGTWLPPDRIRYLRIICTRATPWVPTWETAAAVGAATHLATAPTLGNGNTVNLVDARDRLPTLTGSSTSRTAMTTDDGTHADIVGSEDFHESLARPKGRR